MVGRGVVSCSNRTDMAIQILHLANGAGVSKSQIAHRLWLSNYGWLREIVNELIESDLLSYDSAVHAFKITEEGLTFLQAYNQINEMLKEKQRLLQQ
jgi:predicted transcriptional regulator